ncbi:MAG: hypothetical protein R3F61_04780 [Myxococcota bacterium]
MSRFVPFLGVLGLVACSSTPLESASDADLNTGKLSPQDEWCVSNGYMPGTAACRDAYNAYLAWLAETASKGTTGGSGPGSSTTSTKYEPPIKTVSTGGTTETDDFDPDFDELGWRIDVRIMGQELWFMDHDQQNWIHSTVFLGPEIHPYEVTQHPAFTWDEVPLQNSIFMVHTDQGIFQLNDGEMHGLVGLDFDLMMWHPNQPW